MHLTRFQLAAAILIALSLAGCGGGSGNGTSPVADAPPPPVDEPDPPNPPPEPDIVVIGFEKVSGAVWDELAVRKVLHTFAYGGQAGDPQITRWAGMEPETAVREMLTFEEHNLLLSPPSPGNQDGLSARSDSLRNLANFWASDHPDNGVPEELRYLFNVSNASAWLDILWANAGTMRGLNPFRHKVGFWETNYHMAPDLDSVSNTPMLAYYDTIVEALEARLPYEDVVAEAASSAAIATQYGHRYNRYRNDVCHCNEDFAREFYQLFFGILGSDDPDYHETVTIKNTALAFTDMVVEVDPVTGDTASVVFGTEDHYPGVIEVLNTAVAGSNARERIDQMADLAIAHSESLANLPVMIIAGLADDNLDENKIAQMRTAWASMPQKDLLAFLRAYATSTIFHDESRLKYLNSFDRHMLIANKLSHNNNENYLLLYKPTVFVQEGVAAFRPVEDVFGGQTGEQAADSSDVFRSNFNRVTGVGWNYRRSHGVHYDVVWQKDWGTVVPRDGDDRFSVRQTAEWLWNHLLADGLKNMGNLERAHLYALLATDFDLVSLLDENDLDRVVTENDTTEDAGIADLIAELANQEVFLDSPDVVVRRRANEYVGQAANFIIGTPFMMLQEGR